MKIEFFKEIWLPRIVFTVVVVLTLAIFIFAILAGIFVEVPAINYPESATTTSYSGVLMIPMSDGSMMYIIN
jgi:hypothetical protein